MSLSILSCTPHNCFRCWCGSGELPVASLQSCSCAQPFERQYSTGWFTSPLILNAHVETAQLYQILTLRKRTHYPAYVTAHCVEAQTSSSSALVLFNVLWIPNAKNVCAAPFRFMRLAGTLPDQRVKARNYRCQATAVVQSRVVLTGGTVK